MADPQTDAKIAALWPAQWAKANDPTLRRRSKARHNLRAAYDARLKFDAFKAAHPNARCGNCVSFKKMPDDSKSRSMCEFDSDFHGYTIATADGLCTHWRGAPA
jgi:hypothetical protein